MSHYGDQYEADILEQERRELHLHYSNSTYGISLLVDILKQELEKKDFDQQKVISIFGDIKDLTEGSRHDDDRLRK